MQSARDVTSNDQDGMITRHRQNRREGDDKIRVITGNADSCAPVVPPRKKTESSAGAEQVKVCKTFASNKPAALEPRSLCSGSSLKCCETEEVILYLSSVQLHVAKLLGLIHELPNIVLTTIDDKDKSTVAGKSLALISICGFIGYHIILRLILKLPIAQLEVAVFAYCICTIFASFFWWSKPQSVQVPHLLDEINLVIPVDIEILEKFSSASFLETTFIPPFGENRRKVTEPMPNDMMDGVFYNAFQVTNHYAEVASVLAGVIFGSLYFMAVSSLFPTKTEGYIWTVSTAVAAGGPVIYSIFNQTLTALYYKSKHSRKDGMPYMGMRHAALLYTIASLYLVARLLLIVEMARTNFYLPSRAFSV
jgi:hypothetical protein